MVSNIVTSLTGIVLVLLQPTAPEIPAKDLADANAHIVKKVYDSGKLIIEVRGNWKTVRLAGVDVPKKGSPHAPYSRAFIGNLLLGESVYLFEDPTTGLYHVYRVPDGLWINLELVPFPKRSYDFFRLAC